MAPKAGASPYDPSTLSPPLSAVQRDQIIAWLGLEQAKGTAQINLAQVTGASDADLITFYSGVYRVASDLNAPITGPIAAAEGSIPNPLTSVESFLSKLTNGATWTRVAEFAIGGIMLAIAINALVKNTTGVDPGGAASKVTRLSPVGAIANKSRPSKTRATSPPPVSATSTPPVSTAPSYEGRHDRYVAKRGIDLSAPVL